MSHTPGPWYVPVPADDDGCGTLVALVIGIDTDVDIVSRLPRGDLEADACLISAAPDLLAALQGLMSLAECGAEQSECASSRDDYKRELDAGYAAIAKATGEQVTT